jgi:hypothetical protein
MNGSEAAARNRPLRVSSAAGRLAVSYAASLSLGRPLRVPFSRGAQLRRNVSRLIG